MRRVAILSVLILLPGGCSFGRAPAEVVVVPDPIMYPAPALDQRYFPWIRPGGTAFRG